MRLLEAVSENLVKWVLINAFSSLAVHGLPTRQPPTTVNQALGGHSGRPPGCIKIY